MKEKLLFIYNYLVGSPYGLSGEGSRQWYYFLALVINTMLTWWLRYDYFTLFTTAALVHLCTVVIYGYFDLDIDAPIFSIAYVIGHIVLLGIYLFHNWSWTLITIGIVIISLLIAPDCMGTNIFMGPPREFFEEGAAYTGNDNITMIYFFHTLWFAFFLLVVYLVPLELREKIFTIIVCVALHPLIDHLEGECINYFDCFFIAVQSIFEYISGR